MGTEFMNKDKKYFTAEEVEDAISGLTARYEEVLAEQKQRIYDLRTQLKNAEQRIKEYKSKSELVAKALIGAVQKAEEIDKLSKIKYSQEVTRLKLFHDRWTSYYARILDKYPLDEELKAVSDFNAKVEKLLEGGNVGEVQAAFESETRRIAEQTEKENKQRGKFDPVERINAYLENTPDPEPAFAPEAPVRTEAAKAGDTQETGESPSESTEAERPEERKPLTLKDPTSSGFSFEEALHPTQDLADIMKDLGLLD